MKLNATHNVSKNLVNWSTAIQKNRIWKRLEYVNDI